MHYFCAACLPAYRTTAASSSPCPDLFSFSHFLLPRSHKSNFGGHNKATHDELQIYARVYQPACFRISSTSGPDHPESYYNNTCIIDPTASGTAVYNLRTSVDGSNATNNDFRTFGNTIYAPGGEGAPVSLDGKASTFGDWLKMGLDVGSTISGKMPSNDEIEAMARAKLGL